MNPESFIDREKSSKGFSIILEEKSIPLILFLLTLAAFTLRLYILAHTMDIPGDGPSKAMYAYNWYKTPKFIWHGIWLPGFTYLTGAFSFIVHDPLISIRVLNLVVGALTVPLIYFLILRIYGHASALFTSAVMVFLPVHAALSASSNTGPTFLFELLAGFLLLIMGTDEGSHKKLCIAASVFFIALATMTRYEAWLLIPFFSVYFFLKTKSWLKSGFIFLILSLLPIAWSIGNYIHTGNFLLGFTAAEDPTWAKSVNLAPAIKILGRITVQQIEWTLIIMAAWGLVIQLIQFVKKEGISAEKIVHIAITLFFWCVMLKFAMVRGETFETRYLIFGIVMALPFITIPLTFYLNNYRKQLSGAIIFLLVAFALPKLAIYYPLNDLTAKRPTEIKKLAEWLQHSPYQHQSVLMTKIQGDSTYLPLYYPEIGPHDIGHFIYFQHIGMSNERLKTYFNKQHPSLLITCKRDQNLVSRIEHILGRSFDLNHPVHIEGAIDVYDIRYMFQN